MMTRHLGTFKTLLIVSIFTGAAAPARAVTIQQGLLSISASSPTTAVPATIDSAYVTAVFGNNAYIQDSSGAVYAFGASGTASGNGALKGMAIGTQVTGLTGGGFSYFTNAGGTNSQFQYTPSSSFTLATTGTPASIPAAFYNLATLNTLNTNQGGVNAGTNTVTPGYQANLVTINNVTFTSSTGAALPAGSTFAVNATYTITDSTGSAILYIYSSTANPNSLVGKTIPTGAVTVSGIDAEFAGAPEIQPRGTFDIPAAVPEPGTSALCALAAGIGAARCLRRRPA